jgi:tRNA(Glu) U13 pseudouridine synthase TruD
MPILSSEGEYRNTFVNADNFSYEIMGKKEIRLKFSLPKGSYATVLVDYLFNQN